MPAFHEAGGGVVRLWTVLGRRGHGPCRSGCAAHAAWNYCAATAPRTGREGVGIILLGAVRLPNTLHKARRDRRSSKRIERITAGLRCAAAGVTGGGGYLCRSGICNRTGTEVELLDCLPCAAVCTCCCACVCIVRSLCICTARSVVGTPFKNDPVAIVPKCAFATILANAIPDSSP